MVSKNLLFPMVSMVLMGLQAQAAQPTMACVAQDMSKIDAIILRDSTVGVFGNTLVPASAYDVIDRIAGKGHRPAPISVYRALDFLVEHRFAHRIESRNAYVACDRGDDCDGAATLLLLCDKCGAAGEASSTELHAIIGDVTDRLGFTPSTPVVEIRGLCATCRAAA